LDQIPKYLFLLGFFTDSYACSKTNVLTVLINFPVEMKDFTYTSCLPPQCCYTSRNIWTLLSWSLLWGGQRLQEFLEKNIFT